MHVPSAPFHQVGQEQDQGAPLESAGMMHNIMMDLSKENCVLKLELQRSERQVPCAPSFAVGRVVACVRAVTRCDAHVSRTMRIHFACIHCTEDMELLGGNGAGLSRKAPQPAAYWMGSLPAASNSPHNAPAHHPLPMQVSKLSSQLQMAQDIISQLQVDLAKVLR